jgi:N-acetylglucosaminyldiphosphoundecaprenol N-acetyl-beta-D-mannosaminyltransferase
MADLVGVLRADVVGPKVLKDGAALRAAIVSGGRILTVNLYHLALFARDPDFAVAMKDADYWTADGWPVQLLWRLAGTPADRLTGRGLCQSLAEEDLRTLPVVRVAMIGGHARTSDQFAQLLQRQGRRLSYREHGRREEWDPRQISAAVIAAEVQLVLVAVSSPLCETLAAELRRYLSCAIVGVGGGVDLVTGTQVAAPALVVRARMEWLWRLLHHPRRLWRRYLVDCLPLLVTRVPGALVRARLGS